MGRIDSAFVSRQVTHTFVALDQSSSTVRTEHSFELEAKRPDRFYIREYSWVSKEGIEKPPVIHSGSEDNGVKSHRLHGPVLEGAEAERIAVIDLGRLIGQGEREVVNIEHFFVSTRPENPGFVGHLATEGCEQITLRAILPIGAGQRFTIRSFKSGADRSYRDEALAPLPVGDLLSPLTNRDAWTEYRSVIENPKVGERYRITWDI
ncbi:hypothetical protein [Microbacterium sp. RURRCA19A]|uniref:hypothetical protein n=1 Tax=Microbacterium sp. RURRCA19A TaxID=1907391 RepID=UPI0011158A11|nr:hypothetical protein [Microbacterium sp. RURRCA19A]